MKKSKFLIVVSIVALFIGMIPAGASLAASENEVKFSGIVESLPGASFIGDWRVGGRTVHVTSSTIVNQEDGRITLGATVKVEGSGRADSSVNASSIELQQAAPGSGDITFKGTILSFPNTVGFVGDWAIGGRTIHVIATTRIETTEGPVAIGAFVEVAGAMRADASMDAVKIEIKSNPGGDDGRDELMGMIESLPGTASLVGDWRVSGRTVHVTAATLINREHGSVASGALVEVKGTQHIDGSMDALTIEIKSNTGGDGRDEHMGTIDSLPSNGALVGDWLVSEITIHVTASTLIYREHGAVTVGALVEVKGAQGVDGSIAAISVEVKTQADDSSDANGTVKGGIESLPGSANLLGTWIVRGRTVHVISSTKLKAEHGAFAVGTRVKVKGMPMADGSTVAYKIQVLD